MSYADKVFKETCRDILENGTSTEGELVRPHWETDGAPAYTIKKFGVVNRYDLRREFPAITLRKMPIKSATEEMLWIWQRKSNNINDLGAKVWDQWADENGSIGKAYGYQMAKFDPYKGVTDEKLLKVFGDNYIIDETPICHQVYGEITKTCRRKDNKVKVGIFVNGMWWMTQVDKVIYDLKLTPFNRRIMTSIYCFADLSEMNLAPCAYSMTFNVTEENGKYVLNAILNQRSQDMLAANGWNVCQYSILLMMIAQVVGMEAGEFVHVIADCHIYDRHINQIKELLEREEYDAPTVRLNPEIKDFYDFTKNDVIVENYQYGEDIGKIEMAV